MAIQPSDIKHKLSIKTGAAGNSAAQPNVNASLGKYISQTEVSATALNNLFDDVSGDENAASRVEYRCVFCHNAHATLTLISPVLWIASEVAGGCNMAIGVDPTAASAIGSASAQAVEVATETDAPAGVSFSAPTTKGTGLALGNIPAGQCKAWWARRTATNSVAVDNDGFSWRIEGDTQA